VIIQLAKALQIMSGAGVIAVLALAVSTSHAAAQQVFIKTKDGFTQGNVNDKNVKNRQVWCWPPVKTTAVIRPVISVRVMAI